MTGPVHTQPFVILAVTLAIAAGPVAASATMYECGDMAGARVFTDSPAQLKNCVPIGGANHAAPPFPVGPSSTVMSSEPGHHADMDRPPSYFPQPMPPPSDAPPVADRDIGPQLSPHDPMAAATPEQAGAQRCASSINPFNPLMAIPCPPSGTHAQQASGPENSPTPPPFPDEAMPSPSPDGMPPVP